MRSTSRRRVAQLGLLIAACGALPALAQDAYPSRPIEVIVPYAAGGGVGAMGRAFAAEAATQTNQQWIVLNREGGGGVVGFSALARAKPDGYTIVFSPASPLTNSPFVVAQMPFQAEQIEPVCQIFENVFAVVVPEKSPYKTLPDLIAAAKAQPGKLSYGHAGPASVPHLAVAAIEKAAKVQFNALPYRGDAPAMQDLMAGTIDFSALGISSIGGKNFRVLAVLSDRKHPALPDAPLVTQFGYPAISPGLNGLYVPAGTPKPVIDKLASVCKSVVDSAGFVDAAHKLQQTPAYLPAAAFKDRIANTYKTHAGLVPDLKLEKQ